MHVIQRIRGKTFEAASLAFALSIAVGGIPARAWTLKTLYGFKHVNDGSIPVGSLVRDDATGDLYGTTYEGGDNTCQCGTIFKLAPDGTETILHYFTGNDGSYPEAGLTRDAAGDLYGTTVEGGGSGRGVIYRLTPDGTYTVLHSFQGGAADGASPYARVTLDGATGDLYGTTEAGGDMNCDLNYGCGTVFKLAANGSFAMLHAFQGGSDGAYPNTGVTLDSSGNLYGVTVFGGDGWGAVFEVAPDGTKTLLHAFSRRGVGEPSGELLIDRLGKFYGPCSVMGKNGVIFEIAPTGKYRVLHKFARSESLQEGGGPAGDLVRDKAGTIYGIESGTNNKGVVFKLQSDGTYELLYRFSGHGGYGPGGGLIADRRGNLYGTTRFGGPHDHGAVYELEK